MIPAGLTRVSLAILVLVATGLGYGVGTIVRDALRCPTQETTADYVVTGNVPVHVIRAIGQFDVDLSAVENDAPTVDWEQEEIRTGQLRTFILDNLRARRFAAVIRASDPAAPCLYLECMRTDNGKVMVSLELGTPDPERRWICVEWTRDQKNVDDNPESIKAATRRLLDLFAQDFQPSDPDHLK
jgi:hypothetical protein